MNHPHEYPLSTFQFKIPILYFNYLLFTTVLKNMTSLRTIEIKILTSPSKYICNVYLELHVLSKILFLPYKYNQLL